MSLWRTTLTAGAALAALATASALPATSAMAQASKPNIMFIMGDDIGYMQPSIYHEGLMVGETPTSIASAAKGRSSPTITPCRAAPPGARRSRPACIRFASG